MTRARARCRIVHVTRCLEIGGQEKLLLDFARLADRRRFELGFVSLTGRGPLAHEIEKLGWPVTALGEPEGARPGLVFRLARCLRRLAPDLVHTHDDRPLVYGGWAARLARVPGLVHTRHYAFLPRITPRQQRLINLAARLAHSIVCVSRDSARLAVLQGMPAVRVTTIWNGIDLTRFPHTGGNASGPAVTVARLSPEKDLGTLLRAVASLKHLEKESEPFRLHLAGDGPCRRGLHSLVQELSLANNVRLLGEVRDIPALLADARFFVLPSITEGISLTLLEAMASGLPVLATAVGGTPELVIHNQTGILVPARDPQALARGLLELWRDPVKGRELGAAGRARVEEHFDARKMVSQYEDVYLAASPAASAMVNAARITHEHCA